MKWPWKRKKEELPNFDDFILDSDKISPNFDGWSYLIYRAQNHKCFFRFKEYNWFFTTRYLQFECEICGHRPPEIAEKAFWLGYVPYSKEAYEAARAKASSDRGGEQT